MAPHFASSSSSISESSSSHMDATATADTDAAGAAGQAPAKSPTASSASTTSSSTHRNRQSVMTKPVPNRTHSMPQVFRSFSKGSEHSSSRSSLVPGGARSATRQNDPQWLTTQVMDRGLFRKFEEVSEELARLNRLSSQLGTPPIGNNPEIEQVQGELRRMQRSSSMVLRSQKELQEKIERQERNSFRRFFTFNRDQKIEKLKLKLCEKMSESLQIDAEVQHLERKSDSLLTDWRASVYSSSNQADEANLAEKMVELEREKQDILRCLFSSLNMPDPSATQLQSRIAMCTSEIKACESVKKQVEKITSLYRNALQLLRAALATVVSDDYTGSVREFANGPFPFTIEAGQLIEASRNFVQPEARRRYRDFTPELVNVHPPKFPQAIADFARRSRTHYDPNSALAIDASRRLEAGENVIVLTHRIVIQKLEVLEQWSKTVEADQDRAVKEQRRLEVKLQQRMALLARSVSV
ncbi:hypothetical protein FI667_g12812, partial [Globisporangium splendens]